MNEEFISLFDYLGKPAGTVLGKEVFEAARLQKEQYQLREIANPKYTGKVMIYPKWFLDQYFQVSQVDNLPF